MARNVCWDSAQHHCHSGSIGGPIVAHTCCYILEQIMGENGQRLPLHTRFTVKKQRFVIAPLGAFRTKLKRSLLKVVGRVVLGSRFGAGDLGDGLAWFEDPCRQWHSAESFSNYWRSSSSPVSTRVREHVATQNIVLCVCAPLPMHKCFA